MGIPGGPVFTFISTDSPHDLAQEAIKVHILRGRKRKCGRGGVAPPVKQGSSSNWNICERGGQIHVWDWEPGLKTQKRKPSLSEPETPRLLSVDTYCSSVSANQAEKDAEAIRDNNTTAHVGPTGNLKPSPSFQTTVTPAGLLNSARSAEEVLIEYYFLMSGGSFLTEELLRSFRTSSASFRAFLAITSSRFSVELGIEAPLNTNELESQALQDVMEQISRSPSAPGLGTMLAVALLANLQECRQKRTLAACHWNGLKSMIDVNGGIHRLRTHEVVHPLLYWLDLLVCNGSAAPLGQIHKPPNGGDSMLPLKQELSEFLEKVSDSLSARAAEYGESAPVPPLRGLIAQVLQRPGLQKDHYGCTKWHRAKVACLVYFSALLLQDETDLPSNPVFQAITREVAQREKSHPICPEELVHVILRFSNQDHLCGLIWLLSRLMCAVKQLNSRDLNTLYRLTCTFVGFCDPFQPLDMAMGESLELSSQLSMCLAQYDAD